MNASTNRNPGQGRDAWRESSYLLATKANRASLERGLAATHPEKSLTPEEWTALMDKSAAKNER